MCRGCDWKSKFGGFRAVVVQVIDVPDRIPGCRMAHEVCQDDGIADRRTCIHGGIMEPMGSLPNLQYYPNERDSVLRRLLQGLELSHEQLKTLKLRYLIFVLCVTIAPPMVGLCYVWSFITGIAFPAVLVERLYTGVCHHSKSEWLVVMVSWLGLLSYSLRLLYASIEGGVLEEHILYLPYVSVFSTIRLSSSGSMAFLAKCNCFSPISLFSAQILSLRFIERCQGIAYKGINT